jgi:hypothetical protein
VAAQESNPRASSMAATDNVFAVNELNAIP